MLGQIISSKIWRSQIRPGFFFYVKTTYSERYLTFTLVKKLPLHWSMDVGSCTVVHSPPFQNSVRRFCANRSCLLCSQKLLSIYDFYIEKNSWHDGTLLGVCKRGVTPPCRHWLWNKNRPGFKRWDVSQKCSNWACASKSIQSLFVHWKPV